MTSRDTATLLEHVHRVATTNTLHPLRVEFIAINQAHPARTHPFRYRLTLYRISGRTNDLDMPVHSIACRNTAADLHNAVLSAWQALIDWNLPAHTTPRTRCACGWPRNACANHTRPANTTCLRATTQPTPSRTTPVVPRTPPPPRA